MKRKVVVYEWKKAKGQTYYEKEVAGNGIFHQFGVDYEEFESGPGGLREHVDARVRVVRIGAGLVFLEVGHAVAVVIDVGESGATTGPEDPGIGETVGIQIIGRAGKEEEGGDG